MGVSLTENGQDSLQVWSVDYLGTFWKAKAVEQNLFFKLDKRKSENMLLWHLFFKRLSRICDFFYDKFVEIKSLHNYLLENKP
jgi:hypothetical protein